MPSRDKYRLLTDSAALEGIRGSDPCWLVHRNDRRNTCLFWMLILALSVARNGTSTNGFSQRTLLVHDPPTGLPGSTELRALGNGEFRPKGANSPTSSTNAMRGLSCNLRFMLPLHRSAIRARRCAAASIRAALCLAFRASSSSAHSGVLPSEKLVSLSPSPQDWLSSDDGTVAASDQQSTLKACWARKRIDCISFRCAFNFETAKSLSKAKSKDAAEPSSVI